mgnify:CR=1 FL=1
MEIEILIGILSIIVAVGIALIPYIKSKYFTRPELTCQIIYQNGMSTPIGVSPKTDTSKGYYEADTAIRIFELTWKFELKITNNSDQVAFYPEMQISPSGLKFTITEEFDKFKPIKETESISLNCEYIKIEETTGKDRTQISNGFPEEIRNIDLLLSYRNKHKREFYTIFNFADKKNNNHFLKKRPKDYK